MLKNIKNVKFLIAGGLNIENIQQLEKLQLGQAGYDIASGIETNNFKNFNKMAQIFTFIKGGYMISENSNRS